MLLTHHALQTQQRFAIAYSMVSRIEHEWFGDRQTQLCDRFPDKVRFIN
ncbi:MAG: hypothetical protein AB1589_03035 [Cyanobacteriota bacterium]